MENKKSLKKSFSKFMERYQDGPKPLMRGKYICCLVFTIVPILHFFIFYVGTNYYSFYLAFTTMEDGRYVFTVDNFIEVFRLLGMSNSGLGIAMKNTFILFFVHAGQLCFNFIIAYTFAQNLKGVKFFRVALYLPSIISTLVLSLVVKNMLSPSGAISILSQKIFHKKLPPLFYQDSTAYPTLMVYCIWAGFYQQLLIFEGAIRRVPQDVIESARLDGITTRQEFFYIIIPIMWDTISTVMIMCMCSLFTIGAPILLFTDGAYNTQTLNFWFYQQVQYNSNFNVSAAVGLVVTLVNLPIVFGFRKLVTRESLEY